MESLTGNPKLDITLEHNFTPEEVRFLKGQVDLGKMSWQDAVADAFDLEKEDSFGSFFKERRAEKAAEMREARRQERREETERRKEEEQMLQEENSFA